MNHSEGQTNDMIGRRQTNKEATKHHKLLKLDEHFKP